MEAAARSHNQSPLASRLNVRSTDVAIEEAAAGLRTAANGVGFLAARDCKMDPNRIHCETRRSGGIRHTFRSKL